MTDSISDLSSSFSNSSDDEPDSVDLDQERNVGAFAVPLIGIMRCIRKLNSDINRFTVGQLTELQSLSAEFHKLSNEGRVNRSSAIQMLSELIENLQRFVKIDVRLKKIIEQIPIIEDDILKVVDFMHPPRFELFLKKYENFITRLRQTPTTATEVCNICTENIANCEIVRRCNKCITSDTPPCRCSSHCCLDCLLETFYVQSERQVKSYGTCPTCRSHFCLDDLSIISSSVKAPSTTSTKRSSKFTNSSPKRLKTVHSSQPL